LSTSAENFGLAPDVLSDYEFRKLCVFHNAELK